jgi:hypothetical protein
MTEEGLFRHVSIDQAATKHVIGQALNRALAIATIKVETRRSPRTNKEAYLGRISDLQRQQGVH